MPSLRTRRLSAVTVTLVALLALQAGNSVSFYWPLSTPQSFYPRTPSIEATAKSAGSGRIVGLTTFFGSTSSAYGIRDVTGHTFQPAAWQELLKSIDPAAYGPGRSPTNPGIILPLTSARLGVDGKLLDRMAANTITAPPDLALPGPLRLTDGTPAPTPRAPAAHRIPLTTGNAITVPLTPQNLRGIQLQLLDAIGAAPNSLSLTATINGADNHPLATGAVTRPRYQSGPLQIPIAGEQLGNAAGPLTLTIAATQPNGPPRTAVLAGTGPAIQTLIIGSQPDDLIETFADATATVWSRTTALPRIRWATSAQVIPDTGKRLAALADPATPDSTVLLSQDGPTPSGGTADLTVPQDLGDEITVNVDAHGSGYLVIADDIQSGWQVTVNGNPSTLHDADHAFGAVFLPAGTSLVEFSYAGRGLKTGALITGLALLIALAVLLWHPLLGRRRRRRTGIAPVSARRPGRAPPRSTRPPSPS